ncbi:MAG: amidase [Myxococcales bacterium]|nr:amidase [Myxococcales bacterium]
MSNFSLDTAAAVRRIRARNSVLNAFLATRLDEALVDAERLAREPPRSALHGVPFGLKDEWDTAGFPTTGGSYRHRHRVPERDHAVFEVFDAAGAVLVGKTNLSDMGLAPEASSYVGGSVRNPRDPTRTAGGSSGGGAAAVADAMAGFDWGTDIGGSIRLPAAFCGIFGMRLSSETWPIRDLFPKIPEPLAWLCGQGPFTTTLAQMRDVLDVAAPRLRSGGASTFEVRGAVLYAPAKPGRWPSFREDARNPIEAAIGFDVEPESGLPGTTSVRNRYSAIWSSHFEELFAADPTIGLREGTRAVLSAVVLRGAFGDKRFHPTSAELLALIALGRATIFRDRARALKGAAAVRDAFRRIWDRGRIVVAPVCAYPAPRVGRMNRNPHILSCTVPGNIADATALSVPFGAFDDGLPRALQLMGPPGSEDALLELATRLVAVQVPSAR